MKAKAFGLAFKNMTKWLRESCLEFRYLLNLLHSWRICLLNLMGYTPYGHLNSSFGKNLSLYSPIGAWLVMNCSCSTCTQWVWVSKWLEPRTLSSSQMVDLALPLFYFLFFILFIFMWFYFSIFIFLEQLGLRVLGHAVTSVTTWWYSHKTDHETWGNLVKDSRTDNVIQHRHHMLTSWTTHSCLG